MDILVMNLTRLGDLLQSQPAIAGLAAQGHSIHLACLENFSAAAELMRGIASVRPFPGARILARLDRDWRLGLAAHREALEVLGGGARPDVVINLTPSQPARLLAGSLGAKEVRGFVLDEFGFNADTSAWAAFLQLASRSRGASPFNIVDIFRRISGLGGAPESFGLKGPSEEEKAAAKAKIFELHPEAAGAKGFIAIQLGASEERRRWPVARFADVAARLSARGYVPLLVGTAQERHLGERLRERLGASATDLPIVDLMGATGLRELAATLSCCELLITNDTGTMHLAAGLGVRCLAIFLATAQPWDTGPYLPGCLCLEPDLPCHPCAFGKKCANGGDDGEGHEACRWSISSPGVASLALDMLQGRNPHPAPDLGARAWRSAIGADGLMDLECLSAHEAEDRTRLIRAQRELYRRYLDGEELDHAQAQPARPLGPEAAQALGKALGEAADLLFLLLRQGELLARDPIPAAKAKFLATWQRVRSALGAEPGLDLLADLWVYESERPGLELPEILALAARFRVLALALRASIAHGTQHAWKS